LWVTELVTHQRAEMTDKVHTQASRTPVRRSLIAVALLLAFFVIVLVAFDLSVARWMERAQNSDFFQFWAAGRMVLEGKSPHDGEAWRLLYEREHWYRWQTDQQVFPYPLWTALLFVPLGALPVTYAAAAWLLVCQLLLGISIWLLLRALPWRSGSRLPLLAIVMGAAFEPALLTMLFGQVGIVLLAVICGVFYLLQRGRYTSAGLLLALVMLKPQLFSVVLLALLVAYWALGKRSLVFGFATSMGLLVVASYLLDPAWVRAWQSYLARGADVRLSISPTVWGLSQGLAVLVGHGGLASVAGVLVSLILLGVTAYLLWVSRYSLTGDARAALPLSTTVIASLLVAPYVLSYDFVVLLFPSITCLWLTQWSSRAHRTTLVALLLFCVLGLPWVLLALSAKTGQETSSVVLPLSLLGLLLAADRSKARHRLAPVAESRRTRFRRSRTEGTPP
jgi:hypothetical protein